MYDMYHEKKKVVGVLSAFCRFSQYIVRNQMFAFLVNLLVSKDGENVRYYSLQYNNSREKSRFLPFYYSYSRPLREVRCFRESTELLVAAYCKNSRTGEI